MNRKCYVIGIVCLLSLWLGASTKTDPELPPASTAPKRIIMIDADRLRLYPAAPGSNLLGAQLQAIRLELEGHATQLDSLQADILSATETLTATEEALK